MALPPSQPFGNFTPTATLKQGIAVCYIISCSLCRERGESWSMFSTVSVWPATS
jgi:hypothetical protein